MENDLDTINIHTVDHRRFKLIKYPNILYILSFLERTITSSIPAITTAPLYERDELSGSNSTATEYFDPKERSKERKKNVEMNRTDDKRSNAMAALKAKREGKQRREEEEAKRQAGREGNEDLDSGNGNNWE